MFQQSYLNQILVIEDLVWSGWVGMKNVDYNLSKPSTILQVFVAILNKTLSLTPNKRGFGFCSGKRPVQWLLVMLLLILMFSNSEHRTWGNNRTKSGLIHFQQEKWSVGFRLKRKLGHMMMVLGYLLQNWDSGQDLVSPWLGVTNLTSEKWREDLGSESLQWARKGEMEG